MAIGRSGGRSAGNRQTGVRRATERERTAVDPPGRDEWEHVKIDQEYRWEDHLTLRGRVILWVVVAGSWIAFCVLFGFVLAKWFNVI